MIAWCNHIVTAISLAAFANTSLGQELHYPAPRFPDFPAVVTTEDLMEAAKFFVHRKSGGALPGYDIKPGEKALILVTPLYDQRIIDAIAQAIRDTGAMADVFVGDVSGFIGTSLGTRDWGYLENPIYLYIDSGPSYLMRLELGGGLLPDEVQDLIAVRRYDILINGSSTTTHGLAYRWEEIPWHSVDEFLASASFGMPREVETKLYDIAWDQLKQARRVWVTDPEGTDLTWNLPADITEIKETPRFWREYMCMPDKLKDMNNVQPEATFRAVDVTGVIAGTINHVGAFPRIKVHVRHGRISKIEGGGRFGDEWRKILKQYENTTFPGGQPGPGFDWIEECAIGVVPSASRPRDAIKFPLGTFRERRRSGIFHWAFGTQTSPSIAGKLDELGLPDGHFDIHTNFTTMILETADGRSITFVDKGHLTILDDPELRELAAKYGDPDTFLQEAWVPPVPGINVPGDYMRDYARDPVPWIENEYERFFSKR